MVHVELVPLGAWRRLVLGIKYFMVYYVGLLCSLSGGIVLLYTPLLRYSLNRKYPFLVVSHCVAGK